jgi:hypothetical protein
VVTNNSGGILLTDELGPVFGNKILRNVVFDNAFDCGITVAGHNSHAAPGGTPAPKVGGIYLNLISHNISNSNGLKGGGAGILLAGGGPGTAVYKNLVVDNSAYNNGLAGLTLHDHAPGQFMDGNRIIGNSFDNNGSEGDSDAGITQTADVVIFSAVDIVHGTVVSHNHLSNAHYGIWTKNAPTTVNGNVFTAVAVPVTQS